MSWAVKWEHKIMRKEAGRLPGWNSGLLGKYCASNDTPPHMDGYKTMVFETKRQAQAFIRARYGYLTKRRDLREGPNWWRMPKPVKVTVSVKEVR